MDIPQIIFSDDLSGHCATGMCIIFYDLPFKTKLRDSERNQTSNGSNHETF